MNQPTQFDRTYYSTGSYKQYLEDYASSAKHEVEQLLATITPAPNVRFLDVGCGLGGWIMHLRELGYSAFGTEISPYCLDHSLAKEWIVPASIMQLPFTDKEFDVVISRQVIYYLKPHDQVSAAKELARVARRWIYFETISANMKNADQLINPDSLRNDGYLLTSDENRNLIESCGFTHTTTIFTDGFEVDPADGLYTRTT